MRICTIGFTNKKAEDFFTRLKQSGVKRVVDVRLNNVSQLAGFSKRDDLRYFLKAILGIEYLLGGLRLNVRRQPCDLSVLDRNI